MSNNPHPEPLKLAIPNKGRLHEDAVQMLGRAGIKIRTSSDRRLQAWALDGRLQVLFLRAADIPRFVEAGSVHMGITGADMVLEAGADLEELQDLGFGGCRLVLAVPDASPVRRTEDLPSGSRVATSFPEIVQQFAKDRGLNWKIIEVSGACEVTPVLGVADAIVDLTSSGSTMVMNKLREVDHVLHSTCRLFQARDLSPAVEEEAKRLTFALQSVVQARGRRYLLADIPRSILNEVHRFLPGVGGPSVLELAGNPDHVAIQVVVAEEEVYDAVHRLKELGGMGIAVVPIDRLVP